MFNNNSGKNIGRDGVETVIGQSVKIEGNFVCQGGIIIEGELKGAVTTAGFLEIGEQASVSADLSAKEAKIGGDVRGSVKVDGYLELTASAKIIGDIEAGSLSVARGAVIKGKCAVAEDSAKKKPAAAKPAGDGNE